MKKMTKYLLGALVAFALAMGPAFAAKLGISHHTARKHGVTYRKTTRSHHGSTALHKSKARTKARRR